MKFRKLLSVATSLLFITGCTKLDEKLQGDITLSQAQAAADVPGLLKACYDSYRGPFQDQTGVFSLQEMSTDLSIGPTRGGDWDDNGVWRNLHTHGWDPTNQRIRDNYNNLSTIVFNTTNLLTFNPSAAVKAEALTLRAYAMFFILDIWNQVPFREPGENLLNPSKVLTGTVALDQIIKDLNDAMPNLGDGPATKANKWAAKALLMKCYLNRGVYANRSSPTFATSDLDLVISLGSEIVASGKFGLDNYYYTAFSPTNTQDSKEVIFANENTNTAAGNVRYFWHCSTHYNQNPSGWNGFTTLSTFYNSFDATDQRRGDSARTATGVALGQLTDQTGFRVGLQRGQQYGKNGVLLKDRAGNLLIFTDAIAPIVTGQVETPGIRVAKYIPDYNLVSLSEFDNANNDLVLLRYADVLLMWAEAQFRKGGAGIATALTTINTIRAKRGATNLASVTASDILAERARELYWENWRRNDMIRFNKFLDPYGPTKPATDAAKWLLFPIPPTALAVNPNLTQNPGY